eukprot:PhM_4_TR5278/c0_g1_i1/m.98962/K03035/PSMD12, RPN5; 26S proteasome regulatory subunit N5
MADDEVAKEWKCASWKKEKDFTAETDELLQRCNRTAAKTRADADKITEELLTLEKQCRLNGDVENTRRIAVEAIAVFRGLKEYEAMTDVLQVLMRRRAQTATVQGAIVRDAVEGIDEMAKTATKAKVREVLVRMRNMTEGKLHVELEYGRLSVRLAKMDEEDGDLASACKILQHIQVETMTSMARMEKLEVLVHHIFLCLELEDYSRAAIMSRKIGARAIASEDCKELRQRYFHLMIRYYTHSKAYYHIAMCWWELYNVSGQKDLGALQKTIMFLLLAAPQAPRDVTETAECTAFSAATMKETDRVAWLNKLQAMPILKTDLPKQIPLIDVFVGVEWVSADLFQSKFGQYITSENVAPFKDVLFRRLVEHNLMMVSKYYSRAKLDKIARLVSLSVEEVEPIVMKLVSLHLIYAKIDRVQGTVVFRAPVQATEEVDQWAKGVDKVMQLVNETCHLITKERMVLVGKA